MKETGRCEVRVGCSFRSVDAAGGLIRSATLTDGTVVEAGAWVDATANVELCAACGCATMEGMEARDTFGEPDAPGRPQPIVNGVTLFYRITPTDSPRLEPLPGGVPETAGGAELPAMSCVQLPCGDRSCNMLPTMEGMEYCDAARRRRGSNASGERAHTGISFRPASPSSGSSESARWRRRSAFVRRAASWRVRPDRA